MAATKAGRERNAALGARARRRAIHNTYLTLPVIFTMIATHAPGTYGHSLNWLILALLIVVGMAARHMMILFDRRENAGQAWAWAVAPFAVSALALGVLSAPRVEPVQAARQVSFAVVRGIVDLRCGSCHFRNPTDTSLPAASAVKLDASGEIAARAAMIQTMVVATRAMPPGNKTRMTEEERALVGQWLAQGAKTD